MQVLKQILEPIFINFKMVSVMFPNQKKKKKFGTPYEIMTDFQ